MLVLPRFGGAFLLGAGNAAPAPMLQDQAAPLWLLHSSPGELLRECRGTPPGSYPAGLAPCHKRCSSY
jgi:hypothetical protein